MAISGFILGVIATGLAIAGIVILADTASDVSNELDQLERELEDIFESP
jgi:hypothetical protein